LEQQRPGEGRTTAPLHTTSGDAARGIAARPGRFSNGLKEFLWQLEGLRRGSLLDAGPPWQDTLNFFIERGFKVYTEDLLISWVEFQREEEQRLKLSAASGGSSPTIDASPSARAERFLASNLPYERETFDAILLWDVLDYLDREAAARVVSQLTKMVRSGGVMLAVFHMRLPEQLHRYRVLDGQNLELVPAPPIAQPHQIFQNREIQDLFQGFRSSKFFVGRDQLREGVFTK
jgi:SAM-dependent methyltransferase